MKPSRREFALEFKELTELSHRHYYLDELQRENEPYPSPMLQRLFDLEEKYRGVDTKQMMFEALEAAEARITQLESDNGIFDLTIKRLINTNAAGEADLRGELIKSEARIAKLREALQAVIEKVVHYASAGCIEAYSQYDDTGLCEEVERAQQALSDDRTQGEK